MPIYEYECPSCGHRMEAIQRLGDPVLTDCPACAKTDLRRLVSAAGFRLKGSGWYATDFKDKPKTKPTTEPSDGATEKPTDGGAPAAETKKPTDGGTPAAESKKPEQPSTTSE
ncbi:MAG: FmdB family zinc ribbon protein [Gammaproteobacteria bacterium]